MKYVIKIACLLLAAALISPLSLTESSLASEWFELRPNMSDDDFFGIWDGSVWTNPGKINYSRFPELSKTEEYAKKGDYEGAKKAYFEFYKNRDAALTPDMFGVSRTNDLTANLVANNMFLYGTNPRGCFQMTKSGEWQAYKLDATMLANKKGVLGLKIVPLFKDTGDLHFKSLAGGAEYAPTLEVIVNDEYKKFTATKTGIVKYSDQNTSFTNPSELLARESGYPIDINSKRAYITFDLSSIPSDNTVTDACLTLWGKMDEYCSLDYQEVYIFEDGSPGWSADSNSTLTWKNKEIGQFSWQGCEPDQLNWEIGSRPQESKMWYTSEPEFGWQAMGRFLWADYLTKRYVLTGDESVASDVIRLYLSFFYHKGLTQIWPAGYDNYGNRRTDASGKLDVINYPGGDVGGYPRSLDTSRRVESLIQELPYLAKSKTMTVDYFIELVKNIWYMGNFLLAKNAARDIDIFIHEWSAYHPKNNWGIAEKVALLNTVMYFPEFLAADEWAGNAITELRAMNANLLMPDCSYSEATSMYTRNIVNDYYDIAKILSDYAPSVAESVKKDLLAITRMYIDLNYPDGNQIGWGDSDMYGGDKNVGSMVANIADLLASEELKYYATDGKEGSLPVQIVVQPETIAADGVELPVGYPIENTDMTRSSTFYPYKKMGVLRSGWLTNDSYLFMENDGGYGGHQHPDDLAVLAYAYGKPLLTDAGRHGYDNTNPISAFVRTTTRAHNTVTIDNLAQRTNSVTGPNDLKDNNHTNYFTTNYMFDFYEANTSAYERNAGVIHTRSVAFARPAYWIVTDKLEPQDPNRVHKYEQNWHSSVNMNILRDENNKPYGGKTNFYEQKNIQVVSVPDQNITFARERGYYSTATNTATQPYYISFVQNKAGTVYYNTILYPNQAIDQTQVTAENLKVLYEDCSHAFKIHLNSDTSRLEDIYFISSIDNAPYPKERFDRYTFDGKVAYIQKSPKYETIGASVVCGTTLTDDGTALIQSQDTLIDFSVSWSDAGLEISSSMDLSQLSEPVRIYAPKTLFWVKFNEKDIKYTREADYVLIGG